MSQAHLCASVKKKGSAQPCEAPRLANVMFCGRHARMRNHVLWTTVMGSRLHPHFTRAQALIRGWLLRRRLKMAGPGVLRRGDVANDEDLNTCEDKTRQHPLTFFSFEEAGKVWWFDYATLFRWCEMSPEPVNPYTKTLIPPEALRRMLWLWVHSFNNLPATARLAEETPGMRYTGRINRLCQLFSGYGFTGVGPEHFHRLGRADYLVLHQLILEDLGTAFREGPVKQRLLSWTQHSLIQIRRAIPYQPQSYVARLAYLAYIPADPYVVLFSILSALYRC